MTTWREWAREATAKLAAAGNPDAAFEIACMAEDIGGMPHGVLPDDRSPDCPERLEAALIERLAGRPLQYILGTWDFLSLRLAVGEGVLIPRQDTELLCEIAAEALASLPQPRRVLDLCSGSGCVALGLASLLPVTVTAVEKSPEALAFLRENCRRYPQYAVTPREADVLEDAADFPDGYHAILSNPPYIATAVLPELSKEVQREPPMALDGGADGLVFYRAICDRWLHKLLPGGLLAVEIGYDQGAAVAALFTAAGLQNCKVHKDIAGHDRVVSGYAGSR